MGYLARIDQIKFNFEDAIVIRERLNAFVHHSSGKYFTKSIRALITHILANNYEANEFEAMFDDDDQFDKNLPIKEDGFGKFISRKQDNLAQDSLREIYKFLSSNEYIYDFELPQIFQPAKSSLLDNAFSPKSLKTGEYHAVFKTNAKSYNSLYRFNKLPKSGLIYFVGLDISYGSSRAMPVSLNDKIPYNFSKSMIYGVISKLNSKNQFQVIYSDVNGLMTTSGAVLSDSSLILNELQSEFCLLGTKPKICLGNSQFIIRQFIDPNILFQSNRSFPLIITSNRNDELTWYRTGYVKTSDFSGAAKASLTLVNAAKQGDVIGVLDAIFDGAYINFRSPEDGKTALHWAAHNFDRQILELLGVINIGIFDVDAVVRRYRNSPYNSEYMFRLIKQARQSLQFGIRDKGGYLPSRLVPSVNLSNPNLANGLAAQVFKYCYHEELVELLNSCENFYEILSNPLGSEPFPNLIFGVEEGDAAQHAPDIKIDSQHFSLPQKGKTWPPSEDGLS